MKNAPEQTVFVVDDDAAVRDSIQELVESVGLQSEGYASAFAFLDIFQPQRSGCLVLDVRMAAMSGLVLQEKLNELGFKIPVIVLTGHGDVPMAVQAMRAGAVDFVQKPYRDQALLDSINAALALDAAAKCSSSIAKPLEQRLAILTEREREVLDQTLTGLTSKEIARALGVSPRTVEAHRQNLLRKLGIGTVKELMLYLVPQGRNR
ncbi:MAG: response regulator transcription factor [Gammaproteobacteria bacterium]|nr:response regulator transcription factor [Gammaproteobacteria bacterium]MCP5196385.1 response regulator transcription factor [Gammaproteobacteria bacterium]